MIDVMDVCKRLKIDVPPPTSDPRGRHCYRLALSSDELLSVTRYLTDGGCKLQIGKPYYATDTVQVAEQRKGEVWYFKYFARDAEQADTFIDELESISKPHHDYQMTFTL